VEYGRFERVGGTEQITVDVRIVGATNADLVTLAEEGRFMRDLLDRLSFEVLYLPPLRARKEDILLLATHFAQRMAFELGRESMPDFSPRVERQLNEHPWRGNVRELKNVVERAVYQAAGATIERVVFDPFDSPFAPLPVACAPTRERMSEKETPAASLPPAGTSADVSLTLSRPFTESVEEFEQRLMRLALEEARFNQRKAAALLGLTYHQFRGLYRKYAEALQE